MTSSRFKAPMKEGGTPYLWPGIGVGQVDPLSIRSKLMLEIASFMMTEFEWPYRVTSIDMKSPGDEIGTFNLFGANHPDSIQAVFERRIDISIMNPGAILSMAHRGSGLFSEPKQVALIAVMPHYDQLGFAVAEKTGLKSLTDIRDKRYPLRLSVRGSLDACTTRLVELVLREHGFSYDDIISWGGSVSFDQPMPNQVPPGGVSRVQRVIAGELDAVFEEGVVVWVNQAVEAGMRFLAIDEDHLGRLEQAGFRRGALEKSRFDRLASDVPTVDFSGWPIYCRTDTSDLLVRKFCEGMDARKDSIPWTWGAVKQAEMPLARMVVEAPDTPIDLPFHPVAREFWIERGYLKE